MDYEYRILITMADLNVANQVKAFLEEKELAAELVEAFKAKLKQEVPTLLILTGGLREPTVQRRLEGLKDAPDRPALVGLLEEREAVDRMLFQSMGLDAWLTKPVSREELVGVAKTLLHREALIQDTHIIGKTEVMREVLEKVAIFAEVQSTVLIEGESGTGKELVARAIHRLGPRRHQPFLAVNCAAIPEGILESELFGHEKGAFTGAASRRQGLFELAHRGTLFLDEVAEMPATTQVKLLRVLEEREFMRVGGSEPITVDVRVIAATNQELGEVVQVGEFRDDLYYRLKVLSIYLPPLRERREDVALLINKFIREIARENGKREPEVTPEAMQILMNYDWPGNVRELRNLIESMVVLSFDKTIRPEDIPEPILRRGDPRRLVPIPATGRWDWEGGEEFHGRAQTAFWEELRGLIRDEVRGALHETITESTDYTLPREPAGTSEIDEEHLSVPFHDGQTLAELERLAIEKAIERVGGNRREAAELLGIGERTLYRKLKQYGIS